MARKRNRRRKHNNPVSQAVAQITQDPNTQRPLTEEIATRKRSIDFTAVMNNLPNPDPVLKKRNMDIKVYEDVAYDSRVLAVTSSRKAPVKSKEWVLVGDDVPEPVMDFYKAIFSTYAMTDIISEMLDSWMYGYKPTEIIWAEVDGKIIPKEIVGKPPGWFRYDEENRLRFLTKTNMITGELVDTTRFLVTRYGATYKNPYGVPTMSACFWPVAFRHTGLRFFTQFIEKYGSPFLLVHAEQGAQAERISEIAALMDDMVADAIAVVPKDYDVKLLEATEGKGAGNSIHQNYIDVMDTEIAMAVLGQNLSTEVKGGSYAASQSHMTVRDDIIEGDQYMIESTFDELIEKTHGYNFMAGVPMPQFKLFSEEQVDELRSKRDLNLTKSGVRFNKNYYQRAYALSEDEFELTEPETVETTEQV